MNDPRTWTTVWELTAGAEFGWGQRGKNWGNCPNMPIYRKCLTEQDLNSDLSDVNALALVLNLITSVLPTGYLFSHPLLVSRGQPLLVILWSFVLINRSICSWGLSYLIFPILSRTINVLIVPKIPSVT